MALARKRPCALPLPLPPAPVLARRWFFAAPAGGGAPLAAPRVAAVLCAAVAPAPLRHGGAPVRHAFSAAVHAQLEARVARHRELSELLLQPGLDPRDFARHSREVSSLDKTVALIREYQALVREVGDLQSVAADGDAKGASAEESELAKLARAELAELQPAVTDMEGRLTLALLPRDDADDRDAIVEIRAGTGGDEAALFAGDLLGMYEGYASARGWKWSLMSVSKGDYGGFKEAVVAVSGEGAFGRLKHESGVHRVQRVPLTEGGGRVHTSTASVAVLPEAAEVDLEIRASDLRIDTYRAQGAGGQHVNTTDSAVRITHIPTGVVVAMQDQRSQHQNRDKAMRVLRARVYEQQREAAEAERSAARRSQIGRAERSERVRTYNFTQNRVTDHRVNVSVFNMDAMLRGELLDEVMDALEAAATQEALAALESGGGGAGGAAAAATAAAAR
jgi:peptide chain release factor 1